MITLLVAYDHYIFRTGLVSLLEKDKNIKIIGQVSDGFEVLKFLKTKTPDVILMDIEMPKLDGFDTLRELRKIKKDLKILIFTLKDSAQLIRNIFKVGALGYVQRNANRETLLKAIHKIYNEGMYVTPEISEILIKNKKNDELPSQISKREKEIISLISNQYTTTEIGEKLFISPHTVESHRQNILLKLRLKNTAGLVKYAVERGIV